MLIRKYITALLFYSLLNQNAFAQWTLHITVVAPVHSSAIYIVPRQNTATFPGTNLYFTVKDSVHQVISLRPLQTGFYSYGFTRGDGAAVECLKTGFERVDRTIHIQSDTSIALVIDAWSDGYFDPARLNDSLRYELMMNRAGYYVEINLDSSYKYATGLYELLQKLSLMKQSRALDLEAVIFTKQGNGEKALSLLYKSLEIKKILKDSSSASFVYLSIGNIYENLQDLLKARENFVQAFHWVSSWSGPYKSLPCMKMGELYFHSHQLDSAVSLLHQSLASDSNCVKAWLLLGDVEMEFGQIQKALIYYQKSVIASHQSLPGGPLFTNSTEAYQKIGEALYQLGHTDSAFFYERLAFAQATKVKNPYSLITAAGGLAKLFEKEKKFDSALKYQQQAMMEKDSVYTEEKERQIHNIFTNEKIREQEIRAGQNQYQSVIKIYSLTGLLTLLIFGALAYRARLKTTFKKQLAETEMRALRAQMNPHFIFNCLASINRYIVMSDTRTASSYLTKFSKLIRLILDNSANEYVAFEKEVLTLKLYLDMELLRFNNSFEYELVYTNITASDHRAIPTMIIQPYIENAVWHGLLHKEGERILRISFEKISAITLKVEISDNGIGRKKALELKSKDALKTKSFGMQISQDRIGIMNKQHHLLSSVEVRDIINDSGDVRGTKIILHLPLIDLAGSGHQNNNALV